MNSAVNEDEKGGPTSAAFEKLTGIGLKQVYWAGKCEADKVTQGKYEVPAGESGNYALVFDNSFSKSISKTATVFLITYPTSVQTQISFGAQMHHSQAMASAMAIVAQSTAKRSPRLKARGKESVDSLRKASVGQLAPSNASITASAAGTIDQADTIYTGILQKRRRKKHQGSARRFFCLDYTTSTLSYYHDRNSSALRGAIPLSLAAVGANAKSREISIDSGAEIWHLKANNQADFEGWKDALEKAAKFMIEAASSGDALHVDTNVRSTSERNDVDDFQWAKLEGILSRISGTRDAVRRLCLETLAQTMPPPSPGHKSGPPTPIEGGSDDYFKTDEKKPFWKRKPSSNSSQPNLFKRSVSSQLQVQQAGGDPVVRNGSPSPGKPASLQVSKRSHHHHEEDIHDHCRAMLHDLDTVVSDFSTLLTEGKVRRSGVPKSAVSRLSLQSFESQEFFDAEDNSRLLNIHSDSEHEATAESDVTGGDEDSATSSDIGDDTYVVTKRAFRSGSVSSLLPPKSKSLAPLPLKAVTRRTNVQAPTIMPPSLIGFLRKNVGKDLSTISMPVSANEPTSLLQRAAEPLEYSELLDQAAKATDPTERLIYVSAFAIAALSSSRVKERSIRKPFNPMLGETYELVREDKGYRFISEKVSHRPVQLAFHAESSEWAITQSPLPSQKFWGKSSEIVTEGKVRLVLHNSGELYSWSSPNCFLRNIIAGEKYIDPVGSISVFNEVLGYKAVATFKAKGMFSGRGEEVEVQTFDSHGAELPLGLQGTWTHSLQLKERGTVTKTSIWTAGELVDHASKHYGMTAFAATLNEITPIEKGIAAPTDSRLRPDQRALEDGDHDSAEELKNQLEEGQRARRKEMEAAGEVWKPRWFTRVDRGDEVIWKLRSGKDGYWDERARGEWNGVVPVLKI